MATNCIESFKNWILEAVDGESQRLTKSASATPETPSKFNSNPFSQSMDSKDKKADTDTGIRQNLLSAFSSSNLLGSLARSPLVNKRIKTFITRSETRSRLYEYYRRSDDKVSPVPSTATARSPASSQRSECNLRQTSNSKNASDSNLSLDKHKLNIARNGSNRRAFTHAQNTHLTPEIKQKYDRQDSGIAGCSASGESINFLDAGDNGATGVLEEVLNCSENVSDFIESEERDRQSVRDPFRVVRRPFRKRPRNIVSSDLSPRNHKQCTATYSKRNIPKLKICIQYFQSSKQIRVMLTTIKNLDQLCQTDRDMKLHAKVCLMPKKRKQKSTQKREACHNFTFNDVFYFHNVDDLQAMELSIHLYKNKGRWSRAERIGEVLIPLENFDFCFDTSMWCKILNKNRRNEDTDDALFEIIPASHDVIIDADPISVAKDLATSYPYTLQTYSLDTSHG